MPRWLQELCAFVMLAAMVGLAWIFAPTTIGHTAGTDQLASVGQGRLASVTGSANPNLETLNMLKQSGLDLGAVGNVEQLQLTYWQTVAVGALTVQSTKLFETVTDVVVQDEIVRPLGIILVFGIICSSVLIATGADLRRRLGVGLVGLGWRVGTFGILGVAGWLAVRGPVKNWVDGTVDSSAAMKTLGLIAVGVVAVIFVASFGYAQWLRNIAGKEGQVAPRSPATALLSLVLLLAGLGITWLWWKTENVPVVKMMYVEIALVCGMLLARGVFRDVRRLAGNGNVE